MIRQIYEEDALDLTQFQEPEEDVKYVLEELVDHSEEV